MNVMIDLETLSTKPNAQIISIGAVAFNPTSGKEYDRFYSRINIDSYERESGFDMEFGTVKWWMSQSSEAREEAFFKEPRSPIRGALYSFIAWLEKVKGNDAIIPWSHGKEFDLIILQYHFQTFCIENPWKFWNTRDTRTLYDIAKINLRDIPVPEHVAHHPIGDCLRQIEGVKRAYSVIKSK